jgi:hypothetical protein
MHHILMILLALQAQPADTARANRMLTRLSAKLQADRSLPDSLRRITPADLTSKANANHAVLLDDSSSSLLLRAMAANVRTLPDSLCGSFMGGSALPAGDLDVILPYADSTTLGQWSTVLERIVRARAAPVQRLVASDSAMKVTFLRVYTGLKPTDQFRLVQIAQERPPSRADACWSMRVMLGGLAGLPAADAGPFVRGTFGQLAGHKS